MRAVIDSAKGPYFRCLLENGDLINVHKSLLPAGAHEGDILKVEFSLDQEGTRKQHELMAQMQG